MAMSPVSELAPGVDERGSSVGRAGEQFAGKCSFGGTLTFWQSLGDNSQPRLGRDERRWTRISFSR